jgi:hypothetical protein
MIEAHEETIRNHLELTDKLWGRLVPRVPSSDSAEPELYDEQVWTFLLACGFAMMGPVGIRALSIALTGNPSLAVPDMTKIWLEGLPIPPRKREGNTNLDLAIGCIKRRQTGSEDAQRDRVGMGIQYGESTGFICFAEMKWHSDIDTRVTHDKRRNQLARVIENALAFHSEVASQPDAVYVTLVTPGMYRDRYPRSRLYSYKYDEYRRRPDFLAKDLRDCCLPTRDYDILDICSRIEKLTLNWLTFEELFALLGTDEFANAIRDLLAKQPLV